MQNKKGFIGGLVGMLITILVLLCVYFLYQKMSAKNLQDTVQKVSQDVGVNINAEKVSPQGQVNAVRDLVNSIQDKKNAEIEKELEL